MLLLNLIDFLDGATEDGNQKFIGKLKKGISVATPVFDGADESEIKEMLKMADLPETGQTTAV